MARAIDADKLKKELAPYEENDFSQQIDVILKIVDMQPTLTPPEIVCCQDCVHHEDGYAHWCNKWEHTCPDDSEFFCKYGRKKNGKDRSI